MSDHNLVVLFFFTWSNKQDCGDRILSQIDMVFRNKEWDEMFENAMAVLFNEIILDHVHVWCIYTKLWKRNLKPLGSIIRGLRL